MPATIRLESQHSVPFPRAAVWPLLSKTDWINRSIGLPPVDYKTSPLPEGGSVITGSARLMGVELRWREWPWDWLEPEFYRVHRVFERGPFTEAWVGMELRDRGEEGTRVVVYSELIPSGLAGKSLAKYVLGPKTEKEMGALIGQVSDYLRGQRANAWPKLPVHAPDEKALRSGVEKLQAANQPPDLIGLLATLLREAPDVQLAHLRPLTVAREWRRNGWDVLRLFLHATRSGLLDLSWEVLCPNCRSSRVPSASSLADLSHASHCDVCQIKFDAEFDKSVELKFAVNQAIRPREDQTFCLAGPGGRPHVLSQLLLEAGQRRAWKFPELDRPVRLRSPQVRQPVKLSPEDAPTPLFQPVVVCEPDRFTVKNEYGKVEDYAVQIFNPNPFPLQVMVERIEWDEDILIAARVTNWQEFRDLFAAEVISPHERITVGSQVVLFTDLRGSTAMYQGIGDAPAYALVRNHFTVLMQAVRNHHGAVVKTIGDSVMAVFSQAEEALVAVLEMHERLPTANPNPGVNSRLLLKSSLHLGPCLAVNANDKLDYFGTTVNFAARMVDRCEGGDLTVSDELFRRPEMEAVLNTIKGKPEPMEVQFRGFETAQKIWRIPLTS